MTLYNFDNGGGSITGVTTYTASAIPGYSGDASGLTNIAISSVTGILVIGNGGTGSALTAPAANVVLSQLSGATVVNNGLTYSSTATNNSLAQRDATAGLTVAALTATTGAFSGLLTPSAGITVPTAQVVILSGTTTLSVGGLITSNGGITVSGTNTLTVGTGATTLGGTLGVTGAITGTAGVSGTLGVFSTSVSTPSIITVSGDVTFVPAGTNVIVAGTKNLILSASSTADTTFWEGTVATSTNTVTTVITIPAAANGAYGLEVALTCGLSTGTASAYYTYKIKGINVAGTLTVSNKIGSMTIIDPALTGIISTASASGTNIVVTVTGLAATNIKWSANVKSVRMQLV